MEDSKDQALKLQSGLFVPASKQYRTDTGIYIPYSARLSEEQIRQVRHLAKDLTVLPNYQDSVKAN